MLQVRRREKVKLNTVSDLAILWPWLVQQLKLGYSNMKDNIYIIYISFRLLIQSEMVEISKVTHHLDICIRF